MVSQQSPHLAAFALHQEKAPARRERAQIGQLEVDFADFVI